MDTSKLSLSELFAAADEIGSKYQQEDINGDKDLSELFAAADKIGSKYQQKNLAVSLTDSSYFDWEENRFYVSPQLRLKIEII